MRPPAPAASKEFGSPNACNLCHEKETAQWADEAVRKWHKDDYQKPILEQGRLIDAARKRDWTRLPEILAYVAQKDRDEVIAASLVRLVHASGPDSMWPAIRALATDSSALVRSSVATALGSNPVPESLAVLGTMVSDDYRLVRVRAASSLARVPPQAWPAANSDAIARAMKEYEASITVRSDDAFAQTNLGSYLMDRGQLPQAVAAFETAMRLRPDIIQPLVNASLAYDQLEQPARAEAVLRKALEIEADSVPAHLNLALLLAALDKSDEAETHLRKVLEKEPQQAVAAYNLAVLVGRRNVDEALQLARDAARNRPSEAKYAYTAAYYLVQAHRKSEAETELLALIRRFPTYVEAYEMLGALCTERRAPAEAEAVYREGIAKGKAAGVDTRSLETRLEQLER